MNKIAKSLLSIPATSTASERVFSDGGRVVTDLRNRLKPENVTDLVLLKGSWSSLDEIKRSSKKRQCSS
jgi:zinc finger BED domain-containing protein 1 (E3 SUMO-protein ligase ZBED1)